jgi:NADH-quinone oxidoreductase subunit H
MGGLRSSAQMVSYEIPLGLALISIVLMAGSLRLNDIIALQSQSVWDWYFFRQPVAFLLFLIAAFAETNRLPFDLPEAEQELVAGYHTEYSSMKFTMFYMAEYTNMVTSAIMISSLFFGGYAILPGLHLFATTPLLTVLLQISSFFLKIFFWLFFYIWVRWTLPRFRYDQLMKLGWKVLLPVGLFNIILTAILIAR